MKTGNYLQWNFIFHFIWKLTSIFLDGYTCLFTLAIAFTLHKVLYNLMFCHLIHELNPPIIDTFRFVRCYFMFSNIFYFYLIFPILTFVKIIKVLMLPLILFVGIDLLAINCVSIISTIISDGFSHAYFVLGKMPTQIRTKWGYLFRDCYSKIGHHHLILAEI